MVSDMCLHLQILLIKFRKINQIVPKQVQKMLRIKRTREDEKCRNEKTKKSDYIHAKD